MAQQVENSLCPFHNDLMTFGSQCPRELYGRVTGHQSLTFVERLLRTEPVTKHIKFSKNHAHKHYHAKKIDLN